VSKEKTYQNCIKFDGPRCPHRSHEYMDKALRVTSPGTYLNIHQTKEIHLADQLCAKCDEFMPELKKL